MEAMFDAMMMILSVVGGSRACFCFCICTLTCTSTHSLYWTFHVDHHNHALVVLLL